MPPLVSRSALVVLKINGVGQYDTGSIPTYNKPPNDVYSPPLSAHPIDTDEI